MNATVRGFFLVAGIAVALEVVLFLCVLGCLSVGPPGSQLRTLPLIVVTALPDLTLAHPLHLRAVDGWLRVESADPAFASAWGT
jgi:hypothetical protein